MITKFEIFESINEGEPKIGDYVICKEIIIGQPSIDIKNAFDFTSSNIGKYVNDYDNTFYSYIIEYENIPDNIVGNFNGVDNYNNCRVMERNEIIYWSKNKEELEYILAANKFNL